jgi:hypothetical protein
MEDNVKMVAVLSLPNGCSLIGPDAGAIRTALDYIRSGEASKTRRHPTSA